jgi:cysteine desulfurase
MLVMTASRPIYLDHAATTPLAPEVLDVMVRCLGETGGNPSSVHATGRAARAVIDDARDRVAAVIGCAHGEVVFTSGGTEANNLALRGATERLQERGRHIVVSAVEHDSVLAAAEALGELDRAEVTVVGCDREGRVDPERVAAAVRPDTVLVSVMLINNEVGTVQDLPRIAALTRERNPSTLIHCDAVQALGRVPVDVEALGVDLLSLSAHKAYGPKGAGALYVRRGIMLAAQLAGGGQERNRRSGTENVAGIAGFGAAAALAESRRSIDAPRMTALATLLATRLMEAVDDVLVTGSTEHRAPGFATFAFPGVRTDVLLTALDARGICASGGSACSSGAPTPSHVLEAMGLPAPAVAGALRCTPGRPTAVAEIEAAAAAITAVVTGVRSGLPAPVLGAPAL